MIQAKRLGHDKNIFCTGILRLMQNPTLAPWAEHCLHWAIAGIEVWWLLTGHPWVSLRHELHSLWKVWGMGKALMGTGNDIVGWLCPLLGHVPSSLGWTLKSQTCTSGRFLFLAVEGSEKLYGLGNDVDTSKSVLRSSALMNNKRLSEAAELSRIPLPL